ncbi:hypothetical protein ABHF33_14170 [Chitinibacter sp. FCG-7]|uniref:Uncharacterized protein n=1 Tax=Chitinibacter mangrovi TaxID=3153927 RepID=A0AAU7F7Q2_9NEIS
MSEVTDKFDYLCELAEQAYGEERGVSYESTLVNILEFVRNNQASRTEFVEKFKDLLLSGNGPIEAVSFCCGSMISDTNLGGNLATINEVFHEQSSQDIYPGI